jgi:hypothetical protein
MKEVYFTAGYLPGYAIEGLLGLLNWAGRNNIRVVYIGNGFTQRPIAGPNGQNNIDIMVIPYLATTKENFQNVFGRPWEESKIPDIPTEIVELVMSKKKII